MVSKNYPHMSKNTQKKSVLFICTHNTARSQMAEGFLRTLYGKHFNAYSAGTHPSAIHPYTIRVMWEVGIDISIYRSKSTDEFLEMKCDYVITVCDSAKESCPFFSGGKKYIHKSFEDPTQCEGTKEEKVALFRRVRDEIKDWIECTFKHNPT